MPRRWHLMRKHDGASKRTHERDYATAIEFFRARPVGRVMKCSKYHGLLVGRTRMTHELFSADPRVGP